VVTPTEQVKFKAESDLIICFDASIALPALSLPTAPLKPKVPIQTVPIQKRREKKAKQEDKK
jgi:hypothetical protein